MILVVDDDDEIRETVADVLRDEGFQVTTARDGYEALELAAGSPRPAAILLDMRMPRMNGDEVLQRLRGRGDLAGIPVCVVSAEPNLPLQANLLVQKPIRVDRLARLLAWLHECTSRAEPVTVTP